MAKLLLPQGCSVQLQQSTTMAAGCCCCRLLPPLPQDSPRIACCLPDPDQSLLV